ncbi:hypothetical protein ACOSP7_029311 [Xanthoceras sorbifolium]
MKPEITEEKDDDDDDEENSWITDFRKEKIRKIIEYQKSLYLSSSSCPSLSSSFSSAAASCSSSFSSRCKSRSSLLDLMKGGSTSLRRLFDMEHTSLATYFDNYSGSPITKPVPLWGSDSDNEQHYDPWASIKQIGFSGNPHIDEQSNFASDGSFRNGDQYNFKHNKDKIRNRKLKRKKSFRRLPGFGLWRCRGFRFRLRLKRLRFMICGRKV